MTSKAMEARADRAMQSIASMGGPDAPAILGWLRNQLAQKTILHEDVITGRKSTVGETVRSWLAVRKTLPVQQQSVEAFSSISEMRQAMPAEKDSILKSERQHLLTDRRKARLEARRIQFDSGAVVDIPLTAFAASIYGRGSKWCTGAISANAFDTYARQSPLFILRTPDNEMFQITVDCDPSEFERILLDNGGMFMREALEQFIFLSMTIKNAQDGDLSEDEFNRFMPMANDLFSMIGKSFFAEIKPTWDRYADVVRMEQGDDAEELILNENDILDIMSSSVKTASPSNTRDAWVSYIPSYIPPPESERSRSERQPVPVPPALYDRIVAAFESRERKAVEEAMSEYHSLVGVAGEDLKAVSMISKEITDAAIKDYLQSTFDYERENDGHRRNFCHKIRGSAKLEFLGAKRVGQFIKDKMNSGDESVRDFLKYSLSYYPIYGGGEIFAGLIEADAVNAMRYATLWAESDPTARDAEILPASITEQPWFKTDDASSIKMGILCHGAASSEFPFGVDEFIDLGNEEDHSKTFLDIDMKAYPEALIQLLYGEGLTKKEFLMDVANLEMLHDSDFREGTENELHEALASALCKVIDKVPGMSGEDRMVAGLCLSAVSKDGIEILERNDQWFAQAVYGRSMANQDECVTFRPIRTFDARDGEATQRVLDFLASNGATESERKTLEISSFLSSVIPYPSDDDLADIESMAAAGVFPEESVRRLCDKGDSQIRSTCDRVRAAMATMSGYSSEPESTDGMLAVSDGYLRLMAVKKNPTGVERTPSQLQSPIKRAPSESLNFG